MGRRRSSRHTRSAEPYSRRSEAGRPVASGPGGKWSERLKERGIDLAQLDGDSGLDDLIEGLAELEMDFQDGGERVVIYTE